MAKTTKLYTVCPVLSSNDIARDINWYEVQLGFKLNYKEEGYAVLNRDAIWMHLQYHLGTPEDPVFGSVTKIFVEDIRPIFDEMLERGTITKDKLRLNTPWKTNEFGFYDINKNAIFFVQDL